MIKTNTIIQHDVTKDFPLPDNCIDVVITSPPYWGLRDYGVDGQIGLEEHPQEYIDKLVGVAREIKRVLKKSGSFYLNLGDTYFGKPKSSNDGGLQNNNYGNKKSKHGYDNRGKTYRELNGMSNWLQSKQLMLIPSRVAIALQDDGWVLRNDIIWCLSGNTKVYAKTQKQEASMMIKDIVRLKPETVSLWDGKKWNQVKNFYLNENPLSKIQITLRNGEVISCTEEHRWLTKDGLKKASDLLIGDSLGKTLLPEPDNPVSPSCLHDDIGWFVGVYLAEGSLGKDSNVIQIASHVKNIDRYDRLSKIADSYHGTCRMHHTGGKSATINMYGSILISIIKHYVHGKDAKTKGVTPRCWARSNNFLKSLLFGYLECDGCYDKKNNRYRLGFTRNYRLADDLRTICARLGYNFKLRRSIAKIGNIPFKSFRGEIRIKSSNHHNTKNDGEIMGIQKSRAKKFYDIELKDEPHIFALASGILTHNSKPNPMPSSVKDRLNNTFEHVFHFVQSRKYYYDLDAIREPHSLESVKRLFRGIKLEEKTGSGYTKNNKIADVENPNVFGGAGMLTGRYYKRVLSSGQKEELYQNENIIPCGADHKRISKMMKHVQDNILEGKGKNPGDVIKHDIAVGRVSNFSYNDPLHTKEYNPNGKNPCDIIQFDEEYWWNFILGKAHSNRFYKKAYKIMEEWMIKNDCFDYEIFYEWYKKEFEGKWESGNLEKGKANYLSDEKRLPFPKPETRFLGDIPGDFWEICTQPFTSYSRDLEHFAVFPKKLIIKPLKASCPKDGLVLDPFCGRGTVGRVAKELGLNYVLFDISPDYCELARLYVNGQKRKLIKNQGWLEINTNVS